jgi:histidinol phosphatase-like enzyme (inositol monophosphatase family)
MDESLPADLADRWHFAVELAKAAGQHTLRYFQQSFAVERKGDNSPVTIADREAEQLARERIAQAFRKDAILGEEFGEVPGSSGYRWIIDPIDGTKSFIAGVPLYSTLLGLEHAGRSVAGVIYIPALDEGVHAARGGGAWHFAKGNPPTRTHVSAQSQLRNAVFLTSQVDSFAQRGAQEVFERLQQSAYITRTWGDGYGYLLVATGRADVMLDPYMFLWDAASLQPILEEAGGTFTDWQGQPSIYSGEGLATNGLLYDEVLAVTRVARPHEKPS